MPCSCDSSCRSRPSCSEPVPASPLPGGMRCRTLALGECGDGILLCNRSRMKKSGEKICGFQKWLYLCTRNTERGALVQLVRIRACHARGQGFESPTHRLKRYPDLFDQGIFIPVNQNSASSRIEIRHRTAPASPIRHVVAGHDGSAAGK